MKLAHQAEPFAFPLQRVEAEQLILGHCISHEKAYDLVKDIITTPKAFYISRHETIWKAIVAIKKTGKHCDLMTLTTHLLDRDKIESIGGHGILADLVSQTTWNTLSSDTIGEQINQWAEIIMVKYRQRELVKLGNELTAWGNETLVSTDSLPELFHRVKLRVEETCVIPSRKTPRERERERFHKQLGEVRDILLKEEEPAFKDYLLDKLARQYGQSKDRLESLYYKSLIGDHNEKFMNIHELKELYGNDVREWTLHGWFPKGIVTLLYAKGGIGKTRLSYDFTYHLATGTNWNEFPVLGKKKILMIQTDEQPSDMLENLRTRGIHDGHDVLYKTKWTVSHIHNLYKEVEEHRPEFIIIDSLTSASKFETVSENAVEYARPILALNDIAKEFGCHILLLHHSNKENDARGSSAIVAAVSQVIQLTRDPGGEAPDNTLRIATFTKSRARRPASYRLNFDPETGHWTCLAEVGANNQDVMDSSFPLKERILQLLQENPNVRYQNKDIQAELHANIDSIRRACLDLKNDGMIVSSALDTKGNPKVYFLPLDVSDRDRNTIANDRKDDRKRKPPSGKELSQINALIDPTIAKKGGLEKISHPDLSDRAIDEPFKEGSTPFPTGDIVIDPLSDRIAIDSPIVSDRCDTSAQLAQEENIVGIVEMLELCDTSEIYEDIVDIASEVLISLILQGSAPEFSLIDAAFSRLSPEQQAKIETFRNPPKSWPPLTELKKSDRVIAPEHPDWGVQPEKKVGGNGAVPVALEELAPVPESDRQHHQLKPGISLGEEVISLVRPELGRGIVRKITSEAFLWFDTKLEVIWNSNLCSLVHPAKELAKIGSQVTYIGETIKIRQGAVLTVTEFAKKGKVKVICDDWSSAITVAVTELKGI